MRMSGLYSILFVIITLTSIRRRETIEAASCRQDFSLKFAFCSDKGFRFVPTDLLPDLRGLFLDENFLTTLTNETFERYPRLRELTLDNNNISRIEEGAFSPLKNLFRFSIAYNLYVPTLKKSMFSSHSLADFNTAYSNVKTFAGDIVACLAQGTVLSLSGNNLRKINWTSSNLLSDIYLDSNIFRQISKESFIFNNSVNMLDLSRNPIEFIETIVISSFHVKHIILTDTGIAVSQVSNFFHGIRLSMFIKGFDFTGANFHTIRNGFFAPLKGKNLDKVDIEMNSIDMIEDNGFDGLAGVSQLQLGLKNLEEIEPSVFNGMMALRSLTLDANRILTLSGKSTPWNISLIHLNLAGNEFTAIDDSAFHGLKTLKTLDLSRNFKLQRWWVRYQLFLLKLCFIGYEEIHDDVDRGEFEYDIAIMLDEADDEWVNQHLRPALMERVPDFNRIVCGDEELMLGMYYLDAVHYATEKSFKTIFVISHAALQDQWFMMKFRTVLDHVNDVGTEKMILVFVEDIEDDELPFLIRLFLSDHRPYLVWPDDERGQDYFWEELIRDLTVNLRCNHLIPPN
ncbi:insulin-like growth factor-binding protein complex acid labile subunit [Strongylocentrotus purpuratus]|uniref:TIR domain-containing protein n=1 Tax=Strongylocentrotus purpuratus TaxID=7668 RepID=A0A7M7NUJ9_STRPU|nr:insulin-like growth factor-binding protein complex acid labile subunit [Strongylocentrotus purpuratus]